MPDAISLHSDFKVYEPEFNAGFFEALYQNTNIFNAASGGAIQMLTQIHQGNYLKSAFFQQISSLVTRQDITSTAAVDSKKLTQTEEVGVKLHRKIGPVQTTTKAFKMAGLPIDTREGSMMLGRLVGDAIAKRMASDAIIAAVAAVGNVDDLVNDITGLNIKHATIKGLNRTRGKWGDQMSKLAAWLMYSTPHLDLIEDGLDVELESVAGTLIATGRANNMLNGGMIVSDNENLVNTGDPDTFNVIGMAPGAVTVMQSELQEIWINKITGQEQLIVEIQGEYANTVAVDGFAWDITNGGSNPTDATLATVTNWDPVRTDTKGLPLVKMLCQEKG